MVDRYPDAIKTDNERAACCEGKERFSSSVIARKVRDRRKFYRCDVYRCSVCGFFHIGEHSRHLSKPERHQLRAPRGKQTWIGGAE